MRRGCLEEEEGLIDTASVNKYSDEEKIGRTFLKPAKRNSTRT